MKGRSPKLIQRRNEYLIKRYYYWYELRRLRIDDVLDVLQNDEIFLDADYILTIIRNNSHLLKELKTVRPKESTLMSYRFTYAPLITGDLFAQQQVQTA